MDAREVQLKLYTGRRMLESSLVVDGHNLSSLTSGLTLKLASASDAPVLTVDLEPLAIELEGEMAVRLPDDMVAALVALGWTPPADGRKAS